MSWVWTDLIKKPFKAMITWVGFTLLAIGQDTLNTSELVKGMLNATLECGSTKCAEFADYTENFYDGMKTKLHETLDSPAAIAQRTKNLKTKKERKDPTVFDTALDWVRYQMAHNGEELKKRAEKSVAGTEEGIHYSIILGVKRRTNTVQSRVYPPLCPYGKIY